MWKVLYLGKKFFPNEKYACACLYLFSYFIYFQDGSFYCFLLEITFEDLG